MQPNPHRGRGRSKASIKLGEAAVAIPTERESMSKFLAAPWMRLFRCLPRNTWMAGNDYPQ